MKKLIPFRDPPLGPDSRDWRSLPAEIRRLIDQDLIARRMTLEGNRELARLDYERWRAQRGRS